MAQTDPALLSDARLAEIRYGLQHGDYFGSSDAFSLLDHIAALDRQLAEVRECLEDCCYQFGDRFNSGRRGGRLHLGDMGLSALSDAFQVLGWPNPKPIPESECEVAGCYKEGNRTRNDPAGTHERYDGTKYMRVCDLHSHEPAATPTPPEAQDG